MKTLVNKNNPQIRITAPEIESYREFYTLQDKDFHYLFKMEDWTLVEEEPEGWNKADCVKEIPFSLIYEEFAEHWRLGKAVEPGDYYIPISRLRWGIKGNLEEVPSNVDLEKMVEFNCIGKKVKMTIRELIDYYIDSECADVADECGF